MKLYTYLITSFATGIFTGFCLFCPQSSRAKIFVRSFATGINDIEPDDNDRCDIH